MNKRERLVQYFALRCGHKEFWRWGQESGSVVWADGSLVASREELVAILSYLQATGLPPFGAIAHLVAGCRGHKITIVWQEPSEDEHRNLRVPCSMESS